MYGLLNRQVIPTRDYPTFGQVIQLSSIATTANGIMVLYYILSLFLLLNSAL